MNLKPWIIRGFFIIANSVNLCFSVALCGLAFLATENRGVEREPQRVFELALQFQYISLPEHF